MLNSRVRQKTLAVGASLLLILAFWCVANTHQSTIFARFSPQGAVSAPSWNVKSVSSTNQTKDRVCNQRSSDWISQWVSKMKTLGVTHISVETPYDSPNCGDSVAYTERWIQAIRDAGLNVWHRHTALAFEGIYGVTKNSSVDYLQLISNYIAAHPDEFREGDIFTPIPEPQNGGIEGVTYCANNTCIFKNTDGTADAREEFNIWIRNAMMVSEQAFSSIGLANKVHVGYFGFDGFVVWGDNNPDWTGIIEQQTVVAMHNLIAIDHYPELVGDTMANDLNELHARFPGIPIVISEWGTITGGDVEQQVRNSMGAAAQDPLVIGFQYWQGGPSGPEALLNEDLTVRPQFGDVQSFFGGSSSSGKQYLPLVLRPIPLAPIGYNFESGIEGWISTEGDLKPITVDTTRDVVASGQQALRITSELRGGEDIFNHTEATAYFDRAKPEGLSNPGPYDLFQKRVACFVYIPQGLVGSATDTAKVSIFVKDNKFANHYGPNVPITSTNSNRWIELSIVVGVQGNGDRIDPTFDPSLVNTLGVRVEVAATSQIHYTGPFYIDACSINL